MSAFIRHSLFTQAATLGHLRPRDTRESTHRLRVGQAVETDVRGGAQIKCNVDQVRFNQLRRLDTVPPAVCDGVLLHHTVDEHLGPEL